MNRLARPRSTLALATILFCAIVACAAVVRSLSTPAGAAGIPKTDPLHYGGLLTDGDGKPMTGDPSIEIKLWNAESGGKTQCSTGPKKTTLVQGRFRIALDEQCVAAIKAEPDLWVEVIVDKMSMGRSKVGAVPYAIETAGGGSKASNCPSGYTEDSTSGITRCKRGEDEMVKVGSFWIDRYEMTIVEAGVFNGGKCDGKGKSFGTGKDDDYPTAKGADFPDSGFARTPLYACSVGGQLPSAQMTWFQAAAACELAGKRLCSNYEWQVAALGTPDDKSDCNIAGSRREKTGGRVDCVSMWGAHDMVGNLWEWVSWWTVGGPGWATAGGEARTPWPARASGGPAYGDGNDKTYNLDGTAYDGTKYVQGLPASARRGGSWTELNGGDAGPYALSLDSAPSGSYGINGARCCVD